MIALQPEDRYITCIFGEEEGGRIVQKGVYAKMARIVNSYFYEMDNWEFARFGILNCKILRYDFEVPVEKWDAGRKWQKRRMVGNLTVS